MNKKILNLGKPLITTYPHHANLFSILDLDQRSLSWVFHNYLLIILHHDEKGGYGLDLCSQYYPWHKFKLATCPMLISRVYQKEIISSKWNFHDFLVELIKNENYIYFIRELADGRSHEVFISGFDLSRKEFLCHDFWNGVYGEKWIPFSEITLKGDSPFQKEWSTDYLNGVWAIEKTNQYKEPNEFYYETVLNFSQEDLLDILKEYIGMSNNVRTILRKDNRYLGLEIYDVMTEMLEKQKNNMVGQPFAIHPFHLLFEHKKLLSLATAFTNSPSLKKESDLLINEALKLRNLVLYCNHFIAEKGIYKKYEAIIENIMKLKNIELAVMHLLIENISASSPSSKQNTSPFS
ncbi:hypothetical protein [Paenibacillus graminis]|uniref:hypothetical protein n=2 Tax=Paenibacillus graminis TaxID=189425 RepID=UPI002DBACA45|nr:hypothetical protein [Paenibacillus graminis]MEC0171486.1 hypothetical protein [Paenibacillus graminis]